MRKQVIFLMTDTTRKDMVGCYGYPKMKTPNLDRLAEEGIRYENAYTCQPVCGPARSAIFTGTFPHTNGMVTNTIGIGSPKCLYIFNKQSGVFESLQKEDKELLERPMEFNIWRAPTDNDRKIKEEWYNAHYNQSYSRAYETTYEEIEHKVIIHCVSAIVAPTVQRILNIKSDWEITCDGTIKVNMQVEKDMEFPMGSSILFDAEWLIIMFLKVLNCLIETVINWTC